MPRPCKRRRICALPGTRSFGPMEGCAGGPEPVRMTVDEFEAIRLIDLESLTQEQCAVQMEVARTTAQTIYNSARVKLARCLVEGRRLLIEGGDYILCGESSCPGGCCRREGAASCAVPGCRRGCGTAQNISQTEPGRSKTGGEESHENCSDL